MPVASPAPARPAAVHLSAIRAPDGPASPSVVVEEEVGVVAVGLVDGESAFGGGDASDKVVVRTAIGPRSLARWMTTGWYWPPTMVSVRCAGSNPGARRSMSTWPALTRT